MFFPGYFLTRGLYALNNHGSNEILLNQGNSEVILRDFVLVFFFPWDFGVCFGLFFFFGLVFCWRFFS